MYAQEVQINNVTFNNCSFTGTDPTPLFFFMMLDNALIEVAGLSFINSKLGYRSGFEPLPLGSLSLSMSGLYFENVTMNTGASLIKTGAVQSFTLTDSTFTRVRQVTENDSNTMVELGSLNLDSGNDFVLANLTAKNCSVSLIEMSSVTVSSNSTNKILLSDIIYKDSVFEYNQELIVVGNIEQEHSFDIILSNIEMYNLTFTRNGNLFNFKHQTYSGLQLIDSSFYDIYGGSIFLQSVNLQSTNLRSKLMMKNISAKRIGHRENSFLMIRKGGELSISNSVFTNSYNLEGGSIILSRDQHAVVEVYN